MAFRTVMATMVFVRLTMMALAMTDERAVCASEKANSDPVQVMSMLAVRQKQSKLKDQMSVHHSLDNLRVLLFVTTHLPDYHVEFLRKCWPGLIGNSALLQHADVLFFAGGELPADILEHVFRGKNVSVKHYKNPGYQEGAMLAMQTGTSQHWFDGYDWVIRVNPDVLILDDEWLIKNLVNDGVDGIFADCFDQGCTRNCAKVSVRVNTDFYAVRTNQLGPTSFADPAGFAEEQASLAFRKIMEAGRDRWVPGTEMAGICRIRGHGVPVLHAHSVLEQCPLAKGQPADRDVV